MDNVIELPFTTAVEAAIWRTLGRENYENLMEMWSATQNGEFDDWYDYYIEFDGYVEYCTELSTAAIDILRKFNKNSLN